MGFLKEVHELWKTYKSRRWFQGIVWSIALAIIGLILAVVLFWMSSHDLQIKYDSEMSAHNKTQELLRQNQETLNHYIRKELALAYSVDEEQLDVLSKSNLTANQTKILFDYHEAYAESDWGRALFYFNNKSYNQSIEFISRAISLDPNNVDYLIFKGYLYYLTKDYKNALEYITLERLKKNNQIAPWFVRAELLDNAGNYNASLETYQTYSEICQSEVDCTYTKLGMINEYYLWGKDSEATKLINKLNMTYLSKEKTPLWAFFNQRAEIYLANKKYVESKIMFEKAIDTLGYDNTLISPVEDEALKIEIRNRICWVNLESGNLITDLIPNVKLCILKDPKTGNNIFIKQYDEDKKAFISIYSPILNNTEIKQSTISAPFTNQIGYIDENGNYQECSSNPSKC